MDEISGNLVIGSVNGKAMGDVSIVPGRHGGALYTDGTITGGVDFGAHNDDCLGQPDQCLNGVTYSMWVMKMASTDPSPVVMDTGGVSLKASGYAVILYPDGRCRVIASTSTKYFLYTIPSWHLNQWMHVVFTWSHTAGIEVYLNGCHASVDGGFSTIMTRTYNIRYTCNMTIGDTCFYTWSDRKARMKLDHMMAWREVVNPGDI